MSSSKIITIFLITTIILSVIPTSRAFAADDPTWCKPRLNFFQQVLATAPDLDIERSVKNTVYSMSTGVIAGLIFQRSYDDVMSCAKDYCSEHPEGCGEGTKASLNQCGTLEAKKCEDLTSPQAAVLDMAGIKKLESNGISRGSLLGLATTLDGSFNNEAPVVNVAYFMNKTIKPVPILGNTALAAPPSYASAPLMDLVFNIWQTTRNISFAILAIATIVAGLFIMYRKKLNQQTVVTVQYALPQIALAVIYIFFSYPVGAVLATALLTSKDIGSALGFGIGLDGVSPGGIVVALVAQLTTVLVVGIFAAPVILVIGAIIIILYIAISIKLYLLYFKLIISVITAPIVFSIGAIPGNSDTTVKWFKQALSYVAGAFVMGIVSGISIGIVPKLLANPVLIGGSTGGAFVVMLVTTLLAPFILIFGLLEALRMPGRVEKWIMGEPKRK